MDSRVVALRPGAPCRVDVDEFEQLVERAGEARDAAAAGEEASVLEAAAALYGGDLLPECYDDWVLPGPGEVARGLLGGLARLAELAELDRDYRERFRGRAGGSTWIRSTRRPAVA